MATIFLTREINLVPQISTVPYSDGDQIGGIQVFEIGLSEFYLTELERLTIVDSSQQSASITLHFFNSLPIVNSVDNQPFSVNQSELSAKLLASVTVDAGKYLTVGGSTIANATFGNVNLKSSPYSPGKLYCVAKINSAKTYTSTTALSFRYSFVQYAGGITGGGASENVTNSELDQMSPLSIKGNKTESAARPLDLDGQEVTAMLSAFVGAGAGSGVKGLVPVPSVGDVDKLLKGNGTWAVVVDNAIDGGVTTRAPSQKAVQDALNLKLSTSLKGAVNGLAELASDGKVPSSQLPAIAITDVYVVANNTARNALVVEKGDVAITQDSAKSWIYSGSAWLELTASGSVLSVNGQTGSVSLGSDQISEGATNLYHTTARARSAAVTNSSSGSETDQSMSVSAGKTYSDASKVLAQKLIGPVETVAGNLSLTDAHKYVSVDCLGGARTITLPSTTGLVAGRHYIIKDKKIAASPVNYIRIQREGSNGEKIDGQDYYNITVAGEAVLVVWDGSDWLIS